MEQMNFLPINRPIERILPDHQILAHADGDRLITNKGEVYINLFNDSIRWLCGYDNKALNKRIDQEIAVIQKSPDLLYSIANQLVKVLCMNAGKNFEDVFFFKESPYYSLKDNLLSGNKFILALNGSVNIPEDLQVNFDDFEELLAEAEEKTRGGRVTKEGWSEKAIKRVFSNNKKLIGGFIITPLLFNQGIFLSQETCRFLIKLCRKYKIPVIWDDSLTCFFRSGEFYSFLNYNCEPDCIIIHSGSNKEGAVNLIVMNRNFRKKSFKKTSSFSLVENAVGLIILHNILLYIGDTNLIERIGDIRRRLSRKLSALTSNVKNRIVSDEMGLITFISFVNPEQNHRIFRFLEDNKILLVSNGRSSILLDPQLTVSEHAIDFFIQELDNYFKYGQNII